MKYHWTIIILKDEIIRIKKGVFKDERKSGKH